MDRSSGLTYALVEMDGVFAGDDVGNGRAGCFGVFGDCGFGFWSRHSGCVMLVRVFFVVGAEGCIRIPLCLFRGSERRQDDEDHDCCY